MPKGAGEMTLEEVRKQIDVVDKQIKSLFKERMILADQVARVKAESEDAIYKPDREEAIITKLTGDVDDSIKKEYTALIKRIMEVSRKYQYGRTLELRNCLNVSFVTEEPKVKKLAMLKHELYICQGYSRDLVNTVSDYEQVMELIRKDEADAGMGIFEDISYGVSDSLHEALAMNDLYIYTAALTSSSRRLRNPRLFSPRKSSRRGAASTSSCMSGFFVSRMRNGFV